MVDWPLARAGPAPARVTRSVELQQAEAIAVVNYKIGASSSLLMSTITLEPFMPADGLHSAQQTNPSGRDRRLAYKIVQMAERVSVNPH
jgi:hypothetical protein